MSVYVWYIALYVLYATASVNQTYSPPTLFTRALLKFSTGARPFGPSGVCLYCSARNSPKRHIIARRAVTSNVKSAQKLRGKGGGERGYG